jgi:Mg-chelatase subunit ChlD
MKPPSDEERLGRWRLVLGRPAEEALGVSLEPEPRDRDRVLEALYDSDREGGLGSSAPNVARWLGDIRSYFPTTVVQVMQRDALDRLGLKQMLLEPELLAHIEPDVHLVASLISLASVIPQRTRQTARGVVRKLVEDLERRFSDAMVQALRGAVSRATRSRRPRLPDVDWDRTVRANLSRYDRQRRTVIAEKLIGHGRRRSSLRDVILCVDQSGSMAASVVYSSIFAAVMATIRAVSTKLVVFDTSVVDLTDRLSDPVEVLFGTQLGGGTDINRALAYCQQLVTRPAHTILVLITDLHEGGDADEMLARARLLAESGVTVVCLLALNDQGAPSFDAKNAAVLAALGIPAFACTPDAFPDLMAAALQKRDLAAWAGSHGIQVARGGR